MRKKSATQPDSTEKPTTKQTGFHCQNQKTQSGRKHALSHIIFLLPERRPPHFLREDRNWNKDQRKPDYCLSQTFLLCPQTLFSHSSPLLLCFLPHFLQFFVSSLRSLPPLWKMHPCLLTFSFWRYSTNLVVSLKLLHSFLSFSSLDVPSFEDYFRNVPWLSFFCGLQRFISFGPSPDHAQPEH